MTPSPKRRSSPWGASPAVLVSTPERVRLSVPVVGFGYRSMAYALDLLLLGGFWVCMYFMLTLLGGGAFSRFRGLPGWALALLVLGVFAAQWLYWTVCEALWNGQSAGKRLVGIRVVREDGSKVGFYESAVRNALRAVDFLPLGYALGGLSLLLTRRHQRLGDLAAGTVLTRERAFNLDRYDAPVPASSTPALPSGLFPAGPPRLSPQEAELVLEFLERQAAFSDDARARLLERLLERFAADLSPDARERLRLDAAAVDLYLRRAVAKGP